ncbi:MAG: HEAT repeat domain-containing protein [Phycisphaerae bacterium]|nr:HEAT repeat domain-containing protein [Phycisphaerae bacterium]
MKTKSLILTSLCVLVFSLSAKGAPITSADNNYLKGKSADELIELWSIAPHPEKYLIEDQLLDDLDSSISSLREKIKMGKVGEKLFSCHLLAEINDPNSIPVIMGALDDPDVKVKIRAVSSLRKMKARQAKVKIKEQLVKTKNKGLIKSSLVAIGFLGELKDIPAIKQYLSSSDESVRVNAAAGLALLGSFEGEEILLNSTHSENPLAKKEATYALGFISTQKSKNRLQEILDDPNGQWKSYVRIALANQKLGGMKKQERIGFLTGLSSDKNERVAAWAIDKILELDSANSKKILKEISESDSKLANKAQRQLKIKEAKNEK